ncbi:N-acetylmuramoyl-L-alanine amidase family protein [Lederbergia graminis]|uniref:N-acetylmuramoyl-L-alanine amidase n=1 Tax=Lederbergia graminis TaxID=735518 RepID=A0ABW0LIG6_9BACI
MKKRIIITLYIMLAAMLMMACGSSKQADTNNNGSDKNDISQVENKKPEQEKIEPKYKVVIDAGHGGEDGGSSGASGSLEKDFTLSLSQKVEQLLDQDPEIQVFMTRENDVFLSAEEKIRPQFANDLGADIFVSIHGNTFTDPSVSGTESFYYYDEDKPLADAIHKYLAPATGFNDRGVKYNSLFVLRDTTMPATLLEIGYLTNPEDEQKMLTDEFQQTVAESIVKGIKEYLEVNLSKDE